MLTCKKCNFEFNPRTSTHCASCGGALGKDIEKILESAMPVVDEEKLKTFLDTYVISQSDAKAQLCSIITNHFFRAGFNLSTKEEKLDKTNILLIGDSGSGKTYMVKKAAEQLDVPITIQDATVFTTAGYIGRDVDTMLTDLFLAAKQNLQRMEYGIIVIDEIDKIAARVGKSGLDVGGKAVQQSLLTMLESGEVEFPVDHKKDARRIKADTSNILIIAAGAFDGMVSKKRKPKHRIGYTKEKVSTVSEITQKDLINFGMMAEFIGRLGSYVELDPITPELLKRIMLEPKNNIVSQYKKLYELRAKEWPLTDKDYDRITEGLKDNVLGARGLRFSIEKELRSKENEASEKNI